MAVVFKRTIGCSNGHGMGPNAAEAVLCTVAYLKVHAHPGSITSDTKMHQETLYIFF